MRHTKTSIINTALSRVGAHNVTAVFQDSPSAQMADAAWQRSLSYCLSLWPWAFALRYQTLAQSADVPAPGHRYCFALPPDCLRVVSATAVNQWDVPYMLAGERLHANVGSLTLCYVSAEVTVFPDHFADVLAWRLAAEISSYVEQGGNAGEYLQMFEASLDRAKVEDAQTARPRKSAGSSILMERIS